VHLFGQFRDSEIWHLLSLPRRRQRNTTEEQVLRFSFVFLRVRCGERFFE
jgi:hypothetical protein